MNSRLNSMMHHDLFDQNCIWHPYSTLPSTPPALKVARAQGITLDLADGTQLIDAMASWWCMIHGYNHPVLNQAMTQQTEQMAHVMFGGLTHQPAIDLAKTLIELTPQPLTKVFFADTGSIAVEVAMKMAIQYWRGQEKNQKNRFVALGNAYHGDTFGAMSVCDPVTGMHHLFKNTLTKQLFVDAPDTSATPEKLSQDIMQMHDLLEQHHDDIAAVIVEPIVQGAGGMRFYSAAYLKKIRELCDQYEVLLIADEIATGFGRTGKLFACEHASITADIMCLGKALTGGYLSLAATLCTDTVANGIALSDTNALMHGPTFMANPLACSVANASIDLLINQNWRERIQKIQSILEEELLSFTHPKVVSTRVLGAIGVIELSHAVNMEEVQRQVLKSGVWLRPFGSLIYTMPPYICTYEEIIRITDAMKTMANTC